MPQAARHGLAHLGQLLVAELRHGPDVGVVRLDQPQAGQRAQAAQQGDEGPRLHAAGAAAVAQEVLGDERQVRHAAGEVGLRVGQDGVLRQVDHRHAAEGAERAAEPAAPADLHAAHDSRAEDAGHLLRRDRQPLQHERQALAVRDAREQLARVALAVAEDNVVDAERLARGGVPGELPGARAAHDEAGLRRAAAQAVDPPGQPPEPAADVDLAAQDSCHRGAVHAHAERVAAGDADDAGVRANGAVELRQADDGDVPPVPAAARQRRLHAPQPKRRLAGAQAVGARGRGREQALHQQGRRDGGLAGADHGLEEDAVAGGHGAVGGEDDGEAAHGRIPAGPRIGGGIANGPAGCDPLRHVTHPVSRARRSGGPGRPTPRPGRHWGRSAGCGGAPPAMAGSAA